MSTMKFRNISKTILGCIATISILFATTESVYCTEYWFDDRTFEDYIQKSNEEWAKQGYSTSTTMDENWSNSSGSESSTTNVTEKSNGTSSSNKVKSCDHSYSDSIIKEPTCAESGMMESKCSKCGDTYKTEIPATGKHKYSSEITKEATCTEKGETTYTCTVCGDSYTEEIPAKGHSYEASVTKNATCTESGINTFKCSDCGDSYTVEIPALGHTEVEEVTKTAGMFTSGEKVIKCSTCGEILNTEIIPSRYPISVLFIALGIILVAFIAVSTIFVKMKKGKKNKTSAA